MPILGIFASQNTKSFLAPNVFVALDTTNTAKAATSADGITWTQRTLPISGSEGWATVTYGGEKFLAIANYSTIAASSTDGITWTQGTLPASLSWRLNGSAYGNGVFVAVGYSATATARSTDGITWTQGTLPASVNWKSVAYGGGVFAALAYYSAICASSTNGITWTQRTMSSSAPWEAVKYGNNKFVAVTLNGEKVATSTNGITWTQYTLPFFTISRDSLVYGNGVFLNLSQRFDETFTAINATAEISTDGITWTYSSTLPAFMLNGNQQSNGAAMTNYRSLTYGDGKFVAVSYSASDKAATSTDGITWTARTMPSGSWSTVAHSTEPIS